MEKLVSSELIDKKSPYAEEIESIIHNDHLMDLLAEKEIQSIKSNREDTFYICGDRIIPLIGAKTSDSAAVWHPPKVISEACGSTPPKSVHFHGPYLSYHSPSDMGTHARLFEKGFKAGCAVGIDGIRCMVPSGHEYNIAWTDEFYKRAAKSGVTTIDDIKTVTCTQSENLGGGKNCLLRTRDGKPSYRNIFSEQIWEQEGSSKPYVWITENADVPFIEKSGSRLTRCVISETAKPSFSEVVKGNLASLVILKSLGDFGKKKRILTCFFMEEN